MEEKQNSDTAINHWPEADRPREKLLRNGEHTLSASELLAILLRSGVKGSSALDLARAILNKFKTFRRMSHTDISQWKEFKGLGTAKIAQIRAAIEIGRRFREEELSQQKIKISAARDVVAVLMPRLRDLKKEVFKTILLDAQNCIIDIVEIEEGTVDRASPILRDIFQKALQHFAVSVICSHNHPSGNARPSAEDKAFTRQLVAAGKVVQVKVLDHIIIGDNTHFSFAEAGEMTP